MDFQDKNLTCTECGNTFVFTAGEQRFYEEKGFGHEPRRCRDCRSKRKGDGAGEGGRGGYRSGGDAGGERQTYTAVCSACGGPAKLNFQPKSDRPVFCRTCFQQRQGERSYR